jgi:hypothetical protein
MVRFPGSAEYQFTNKFALAGRAEYFSIEIQTVPMAALDGFDEGIWPIPTQKGCLGVSVCAVERLLHAMRRGFTKPAKKATAPAPTNFHRFNARTDVFAGRKKSIKKATKGNRFWQTRRKTPQPRWRGR